MYKHTHVQPNEKWRKKFAKTVNQKRYTRTKCLLLANTQFFRSITTHNSIGKGNVIIYLGNFK